MAQRQTTLVLLAVLVGETLIGYGMLFAVQANPTTQPVPAYVQTAAIDQVRVVTQEQEGDQEEIIVEPPVPPSFEPITLENRARTPQGQLAQPPDVVRAVYLTGWSAGSETRIKYVLNLANTTNINAVVVDIKDFSGEITYNASVPEAELYGAEVVKIPNVRELVNRFHDEDIYVIARITVFQDPILARARPDLAVQHAEEEGVWTDYKGLAWIDPAATEAWNYTVAIANDVAAHGFDEINFDYIRFPSDGNLETMEFPFTDEAIPKSETLGEFFAYLQEHITGVPISADVFGLATLSRGDLGIGQIIEIAYEHFDYVCPMVYPSHYADGFQGYIKPAEYPYEVVKHSLQSAQARLEALRLEYSEKKFAKLRPWLQDFDLGADYDELMVQAQIQATKEAIGEEYNGYLLWAPTNYYTVGALTPFAFNKESYNAKDRTTQQEYEQELAEKLKQELKAQQQQTEAVE